MGASHGAHASASVSVRLTGDAWTHSASAVACAEQSVGRERHASSVAMLRRAAPS